MIVEVYCLEYDRDSQWEPFLWQYHYFKCKNENHEEV